MKKTLTIEHNFRFVIFCVLFGCLTIGCSSENPSPKSGYFDGSVPDVELKGSPRSLPNIFIISLDTLRWDNLLKKNSKLTSLQGISQFKKDSLVLNQVISTSSWTLPSHASFFTGELTTKHGAYEEIYGRMSPSIPSYVQVFNDVGYQTVAFTGGGYVGKKRGFSRGFNFFAEKTMDPNHRPKFQKTVDLSKRWIKRKWNHDNPLFMFLHTYQIHDYWKFYPHCLTKLRNNFPYLAKSLPIDRTEPAPIEYWKNLNSTKLSGAEFLYECGIRETNLQLKKFLDFLKEQNLYNQSLIIVFSDHGEGFSLDPYVIEHGKVKGKGQLHEVLIRVPFIIKFPGNSNHSQQSTALLSIRQILPLISSSLGINVETQDVDGNNDSFLNDLRKGNNRSFTMGSVQDSDGPKVFVRGETYKIILSSNHKYTFYRIDEQGQKKVTNEGEIPQSIVRSLIHRARRFRTKLIKSLKEMKSNRANLQQSDKSTLKGLGYY